MRNYKITSLTLCTIIGAGFATGKELLTYFVNYGITGFWGIFFASLLFALIIHKIMLCPYSSLEELLQNYFFGKPLLIITELFLLVLYSAMLSASGEVLNTMFHINKLWGSILTSAIVTIIIIKGYDMVSDLSDVIFIPIVIIIFIISITAAEKSIGFPPQTITTPKSFFSPLIYVSYNMLTTIPLLITIPDKYMYRNCGNQVGIVIFILSVMIIIPLYTHYSLISSSTLPLMALLTGKIKYLYELLLMLAIFSTAVSSAYSFLNSLKKQSTLSSVLFVNICAIIMSLLGFSNIVNKVYFIFGIAGIILLIILFIPNKSKISK
ncbi:MAG: hypothetical protein Q4F63_08170 [Clostridia bacterium]|nr:hypothetical protein [Clostridia bacterium]